MQIREPLFDTIGHPIEEAPNFRDLISFRRYFLRRVVTKTRVWYEFRRRDCRPGNVRVEHLVFAVMVERHD